MKKAILLSTTILSFVALGACSHPKSSEKQNRNETISSSSSQKIKKATVSSSETKVSSKTELNNNKTETSMNNADGNSQRVSGKSDNGKVSSSSLSGYNSEQIEYARVTEAILNYYNCHFQPVSISVVKNGANHQVFPFSGSVVVPKDTVTLSFSSDNTMAGTIIVTYSSNYNGTINFYKDPNHYQDDRYVNDSSWVKQESQKLLNSAQTLEIKTSSDEQAAQIISKIEIK